MSQRIAFALSAVILAGAVSASTPESTSFPFDFTTTNRNMWTGSTDAEKHYIQTWSTSFDDSSTGGGTFSIDIPALVILGVTIWPEIDLGDFGGGYTVGAKGLVGGGFDACYNAGSVDSRYKGWVTFTYPERDTIPSAAYQNFQVDSSITLDDANSHMQIESPNANFMLLARLRIYFTFEIWAEAFSSTFFDWKPLNNDGFDTADIGNMSLPLLGEVGVRNPSWIPWPTYPGDPGYDYLEIFSTKWLRPYLTFKLNSYLSLPDKWSAWIVGKVCDPTYTLNQPPVSGTNYFQLHGEANVFTLTFSLTNVIISLVSEGAIPGPNRDYSVGGFSAGFHILDLYASFVEALSQDFTYTPTIQYCLTPTGQGTTNWANVGTSTTLLLPPATDYVDVQPSLQIQQTFADFSNTSDIAYTFSTGFIPFEVYGSGSVAGYNLFSFDICPWKWIKSYTYDDPITSPSTITFVLTYDNPEIDSPLSIELNSPTFRIYPALGPWFTVDSFVASADWTGQAAVPNFMSAPYIHIDHDNVTPKNLLILRQLNASGTTDIAPGTMYPMDPSSTSTIYNFTIRVTDAHGNYTDHGASLTIRDTTPPYFIDLPAPITVHHTDPLATPVNVPLPRAADNVDPNPFVTSDSPGVFPIGTTQVTFTARDLSGNTSTCFTTVTVLDDPPDFDLCGPYVVNEGDSIVLTAFATDTENDPLEISWDLDKDGTFETPGASVVYHAIDGPAVWTVQAKVTELIPSGLTVIKSVDITILNMPPVLGDIVAPSGLFQAGTSLEFSAPFADPGILDTHTGTWNWGDGTTSPAKIDEENGSGTAGGAHTYTEAGLYTVGLTVTDKDGASDSKTYQFVYVYTPPTVVNSTTPGGGESPGGGAVLPSGTGGLIETGVNSPKVVLDGTSVKCGNAKFNVSAGAVLAKPTTSGQASLSLNLGYKKGAATPSGTVKFAFKAGSLSYSAKAVSYLAIGHNKTYFIAKGQINKAGNFQCFGVLNKKASGQEYVRLRITDSTGAIILDTQAGAPDDADATAAFTKKNILKIK